MVTELTPVELRNGLWYKREDLHRSEKWGVNGAKYRAAQHLISQAKERGADTVVSAASVLSPQSAMAAVVAGENGMFCNVIVGGTTPEKAIKHLSIKVAQDAGATLYGIPVGYNPALQKAALQMAEMPGAWRLPYGITTPPDSTEEDIEAFLRVGSPQTQNLPDDVETIILPFGSGNTAAGVLYGLHDSAPARLKRVVLVGIGPDRQDWVAGRLKRVGRNLAPEGVEIQHRALHPVFATYSDRMKETLDGIVMHPTYEGKVVRYLNMSQPGWWAARDEKALLWIVGGPL